MPAFWGVAQIALSFIFTVATFVLLDSTTITVKTERETYKCTFTVYKYVNPVSSATFILLPFGDIFATPQLLLAYDIPPLSFQPFFRLNFNAILFFYIWNNADYKLHSF